MRRINGTGPKIMLELQFITHDNGRYGYADSAEIALEGGCRWIQLRMKDADTESIIRTAEKIRKLCDSCGAVMILDDHVELVGETGADGVHLGKLDMPVRQAREILGRDKIIGGTANTMDDIEMHYSAGADYIGCGPMRFTSTKKNLSPVLGIEGYREIRMKMENKGISIPVVAIGGITYDDIDAILGTGINGIALSGSILNAADPAGEMKRITKKITEYINKYRK